VISRDFVPSSFSKKEMIPPFLSLALLLAAPSRAHAQTGPAIPDAPSYSAGQAQQLDHVPLEDEPHSPVTLRNVPRHMAADAVHILIAPAYLRTRDLKWLLPLTAAGATAFATDTHTMRDVVSHDPSFNQTAINVSDGLRYGFIAAPVGMYAWGKVKNDERSRETGILASQAWVEAYIVGDIVKLCSFRERPTADNAKGDFYIGASGADSSFISGHSLVAWSSAAVIAGEYRNPWAQLGVYTAATGVSLTRVLGQQHFPSDVLIGSSVGWLIGHYVYRAHHHAPRIK
jgi:membrane-associated phospholipid phosphatase